MICLAQRGQVQWRSATVLSRHFFGTVHVFPDKDARQAVKNVLEILGNDVTNNDTSWAAMEIGSQVGKSPMDLTCDTKKKAEYFKYVTYLLPVVIVLILLVVQNVL